MSAKLKIDTKDILNIEMEYIRRNCIPDREIGKSVHFYNYFSAGLAVLVSVDDDVAYKTTQGNRKYAILKGSYSARVLNNNTQAILLNNGIIEEVTVNGSNCFIFKKDSPPLTVGSVMTALTVKDSPSPKQNYFLEDLRLCSNNQDVAHAKQSDNTILADGLSDAGFNIIVDKFINSIIKDNISIMDMIAEKVLEKQYKDSHTYKYQQSYDGVYKIKNIYSNEIIKRSIEILDKNRRLLIMGNTGDGKTSLAYLLAKEITGEDIGEPTNAKVDTNYYRICIAGAGDGNTLWEIDDREKNLGKLRLFVEHIQKEKITQPCVFICNEIQVSDLRYLIGNNLFEDFSNSKRSRILPDNLFLIFTGCTDSDFGIDEQITQRITPVEIKGLYANDNDIKIKLADAFPSDNGGKIIDTVAEINSTEEYTVITMRKLIQMLRGEKPNLGIREDTLSNKSKKLLEELRGYYDN